MPTKNKKGKSYRRKAYPVNNLTTYINSVKHFSKTKRKTLNYLISLFNRYGCAYPNQTTIANKAHCTREWVSKLTTELVSDGFLHKDYRQNKSCVYMPTSLLLDFWNRQALKDLLPALSWRPLTLGLLIIPALAKSSHEEKEELLKLTTNVDYYTTVDSKRACAREKNEVKMKNVVIERLGEKLKLDSNQKEQLEWYPDSILLLAEKTLIGRKVDNPVAYFFGICKKQQALRKNSEENSVKRYVSDNFGLKKESSLKEEIHKAPIYTQVAPKQYKILNKEDELKKRDAIYASSGWHSFPSFFGMVELPPVPEEVEVREHIYVKTDMPYPNHLRKIKNPDCVG